MDEYTDYVGEIRRRNENEDNGYQTRISRLEKQIGLLQTENWRLRDKVTAIEASLLDLELIIEHLKKA